MAKFVNTSHFLELNVGFALDEGMASPTEQFPLFYGERSIWRKCIFIYICMCVCVCVFYSSNNFTNGRLSESASL